MKRQYTKRQIRVSFSRYTPIDLCGKRMLPDMTLAQLLRTPDLIARAEQSGCEACYVEVARWSCLRSRWERFAFEKFFGGEIWPDLGQNETCEKLAKIINDRSDVCGTVAFIHNLPSFNSAPHEDLLKELLEWAYTKVDRTDSLPEPVRKARLVVEGR